MKSVTVIFDEKTREIRFTRSGSLTVSEILLASQALQDMAQTAVLPDVEQAKNGLEELAQKGK